MRSIWLALAPQEIVLREIQRGCVETMGHTEKHQKFKWQLEAQRWKGRDSLLVTNAASLWSPEAGSFEGMCRHMLGIQWLHQCFHLCFASQAREGVAKQIPKEGWNHGECQLRLKDTGIAFKHEGANVWEDSGSVGQGVKHSLTSGSMIESVKQISYTESKTWYCLFLTQRKKQRLNDTGKEEKLKVF